MKLSIRDLDLAGRRVFIRVDFNVPLENGVVTDDTRIRASVPTIRYALERGATVILASHLGRPKGQVNPKYSLKPVAPKVAELLGRPVSFATGLHRRRGEVGRGRGASRGRRRRAAGKPAIPSGRGKKRRGVRPAARVADRLVRQRRVRRRAPRSRLGRSDHARRAQSRGRAADGERAGVPRPRADVARPPARGDSGRRESLRQARGDSELSLRASIASSSAAPWPTRS